MRSHMACKFNFRQTDPTANVKKTFSDRIVSVIKLKSCLRIDRLISPVSNVFQSSWITFQTDRFSIISSKFSISILRTSRLFFDDIPKTIFTYMSQTFTTFVTSCKASIYAVCGPRFQYARHTLLILHVTDFNTGCVGSLKNNRACCQRLSFDV